jgi:hypothetical protein
MMGFLYRASKHILHNTGLLFNCLIEGNISFIIQSLPCIQTVRLDVVLEQFYNSTASTISAATVATDFTTDHVDIVHSFVVFLVLMPLSP